MWQTDGAGTPPTPVRTGPSVCILGGGGEVLRDGAQEHGPCLLTSPPCTFPAPHPQGGAWHRKRAVVSPGWMQRAGGLDGLGEKPEDMTRLPWAPPARPSLRKWQGPSFRCPQGCLRWASAIGHTSEGAGPGAGWWRVTTRRGGPRGSGRGPPNHTYPTLQAGFGLFFRKSSITCLFLWNLSVTEALSSLSRHPTPCFSFSG